jgi:Divergent InlB B-repeat domain
MVLWAVAVLTLMPTAWASGSSAHLPTSPGLSGPVPGSSVLPVAPPSERGNGPAARAHSASTPSPPSLLAPRAPKSAPSPAATGPAGSAHYGNVSDPVAPSGDCFGIWPPGGQGYYANGCYGHDEPGIQFYSTLPGSGGNVTWNITLPISRNSSATQSDLYTAIWFGMTLADPFGWLDQCFLELQFYPDSDWNSYSPVFGRWVGAAVAWQIEASSGQENACFYQPLTLSDGSELAMSDGDQVNVTMTGWVGDPYGENLTISDGSNGEVSQVTLVDTSQGLKGFPLDPAYGTNVFPNALQWTPGGELPVVFAFETGHTSPPFPNSNAYGGCSSGPPPPTSRDPAVPCPSYDPGSWVNDTRQPWRIDPPTFFNATARETPAQVSFTQDLGGVAFIDPLSNGTCDGRDGSAWCSYPWYSYSCADRAFEFGATDWGTTSADFGGFREYAEDPVQNGLQMGFYPPTNFSVPTCGGPAYSVAVASTGGGAVMFLSQAVNGTQTFGTVGPGEYALAATARPGLRFVQWNLTGSVAVTDDRSPTTTLRVGGNGTVSPWFSAMTVPTTPVTFSLSPPSAHVVIFPTQFYTTGIPIATVGNGGSVDLAPGTYSIQAYPPSGYNFTGWTVTGAGGEVAAPTFPYTWLLVPSGGLGITVNGSARASTATDQIYYGTYSGHGSVSFDGSASTTSGSTTVTVGTYPIVAAPSAGWAFDAWYISSSGIMSDFRATTNLTLEAGLTYYAYAAFAPSVTVVASPSDGGQVAVGRNAPSANQSLSLDPGFYSIVPAPAGGYALSGWTVSSSADLWVYASGGGRWGLEVNHTGTVTADFSPAPAVNLTFHVAPSGAGTVRFNFAAYGDGEENVTLTEGNYSLSAAPTGPYNFSGWAFSGPVALTTGGRLDVTGAGGVVTARFSEAAYPVTLILDPPGGTRVRLSGGSLGGANLSLGHDETAWLGGPDLVATALVGANASFVAWATSPGLAIGPDASANLTVASPGTLTLFTAGFGLAAELDPSAIDLGQTAVVRAILNGTGTFAYTWSGLPPGCAAASRATITCIPTSTGSFPVEVTVASGDGTERSASAGTLRVVPDLVVTAFSVAPDNLTVGESMNLSTGLAGGVSPATIRYTGLPTGCAGANSTTLTCTPSGPGVSTIGVEAVDAAGFTVGANATVAVYALPSLQGVGISPNATDIDWPVVLTVSVGGGRPPLSYTYAGLPAGCFSANVSVLTCVPTQVGTFTIVVAARDADGFSSSRPVDLVVNPALRVTGFAASAWSGRVNGSVTFAANVTGGTGPVRFSYAGLPPGCGGLDAPTLACSPSAAGNYTIVVTAVDTVGARETASLALRVAPAAHPTSPPPGPSGEGGFAGIPYWAWTVVAAIALATAGTVTALWRRARRRAPLRPGTGPSTGTPPSPPP